MTIPHPFKFCVAAALSLLAGLNTQAAVIGINPPVPPLTLERLAEAKPEARQEWTNYLQRSAVQRERDRATLAAERVRLATIPPVPEGGNSEKSMPLDQPAAWYASTAALAVADNMVSFQTPAGGWGKNQPRDRPARLLGQDYVANNASKFATADDFEKGKGHDPQWNYVGTIDNDATITEIRFLARVAAQVPPALADTYRKSAIRGLGYLLDAQFPNGGWPQVWPLQGGYHDATTLNDNAMVQVATLMGAAARGEDDFGFLPPALRDQVATAERRAINALLQLQITVGGRKMLWAQQYEALTGAPASARNYEPGALCASESAQVLNYLMSLPTPRPEVIAAVHSGAAALRALVLEGVVWTKVDELQGRRLVARPGAAPLWARYYSADTLKPVFGNRDKSLHDDINDITLERRNGYAWFVTIPGKTLATYEGWARRWGGTKAVSSN